MPINPHINEMLFDKAFRKDTSTGYIGGVTVDLSGFFYIVELTGAYGTSDGGGASFIVTKYDTSNTQVWSTTTTTSRLSYIASGAGYVIIHGIAVDTSGCAYIYGVSQWSNIGTVFSGISSNDPFIIKFTNAGIIQWGKQVPTTWSSSNRIYDLKINTNTIILCGYLGECVIHKYGLSGNFLSKLALPTTTYHIPRSITADSSNNIYISGYFGLGSRNTFLNKYSWDLVNIWSRDFPGVSSNAPCTVTPDNQYIYISYISNGMNVTVRKYNTEGTQLWETGTIVQNSSSPYASYIACDNNYSYILTSNLANSIVSNFIIKIESSGSIKSSLNIGNYSSMGRPVNICMDTTRYIVFCTASDAAYKYIPDYFKIVKDFYALYKDSIPNITIDALTTNTKTVTSYIDSSGTPTAAWTALADKSIILTTGETAYIDLATVVTAAYRSAYTAATTGSTTIPGFSITDAAANTAGTTASAVPTDYTAANSQLQTYAPKRMWVAVGNFGKIATSLDGMNWAKVTTSSFNSNLIKDIAWNGSIYIAVGNSGNIATSTNGTNWTAVASTTFGSTIINAITWNGVLWIAVGDSGKMATSSNGTNWTAVATSSFGTSNILDIAWNGSLFVAVGADAKISKSTNGINWTAVTWSATNTSPFGLFLGVFSIAWNGSMWVATGGGGVIATSSNITTWTSVTWTATNPISAAIYEVAWNGERWMAVGNTNIVTSTNGTSWTPVSISLFSSFIRSIAWNGSMWVAANESGKMATSPSGTDWTAVVSSSFDTGIFRVTASLTNSYITSLLAELKTKVASIMAVYLTTKATISDKIPTAFLLSPAEDQPNIDLTNEAPFAFVSGTYSFAIPTLSGSTTTVSEQTYTVTQSSGDPGFFAFADKPTFYNGGTYGSPIWATNGGVTSDSPQWVQISMSTAVSIAGYKFVGANVEGTTPSNFKLQGTNDASPNTSSTWIDIDVQIRNTKRIFDKKFLSTASAYKTYRLFITATTTYTYNVFLNSLNFYTFSGKLTKTKQDQLIQLYNKYNTAVEGLGAIASAAIFKTSYESARRFITDATLASDTITLREAIYTDSRTYMLSDITKGRRDIMKTLITRYFLLNPSGTTSGLAPSLLPISLGSAVIPLNETITDSTTAEQLTTFESTYLTGINALWPALLNRIRTSIQSHIDAYKSTRDAAVVTSGSNFYSNATCDADKNALTATNFARTIAASGVVSYIVTTPSSTAESEYAYITSTYTKYSGAISNILVDAKIEAGNALSSFTTLYTTRLLNCRPITSSTILQTAINNHGSDQINIDTASTITNINTYRDRYKEGIVALFIQVRSNQLAIADKYIKLYNKYGSFLTNSAITSYIVTLAVAPVSTVPDASTDHNNLSDLPTSVTMTSLPTEAQIGTLQTFCTNYGGATGYYANLVSHIRTNLLNFIIKYDQIWNALSADVKRTYASSYTSPLTNGAYTTTPSDTDLYDYMNQYAGFTRDSLTSTSTIAPTTSYTSTISTAITQANALAEIVDFGSIYVAVSDILNAVTDTRMSGITSIIGNSTTPNTINKIIIDATSTTVSISSATLLSAVTLVTGSAFQTARTNMLGLAKDNLNILLSEYRNAVNAYRNFRTTFSGIAELPTLTDLSAVELSATTTMSNLVYTKTTSGAYTANAIGGINLFGSLTNYETFASYVSQYAGTLQIIVYTIQQNAFAFRSAIPGQITPLATIATNSAVGDSYLSSLSKSGAARTSLTNLSNDLLVGFMKLYFVNTWIPGRRYLYDSTVTSSMTSFATTCNSYITPSGSIITSPFTVAGTDTYTSLMSSASTALADASRGLALAYDTVWTTWVTGRSITTSAIQPITADSSAGTDSVRAKYLNANAWPTLLTDIKAATRTKVIAAKELQDWLTGSRVKTVKGVSTSGLGQTSV